MNAEKVAIFGGAFDPVHNGHLRAIVEIKKYIPGVPIWVVPMGEPPHARHAITASAEDRLNMLALALENIDGVTVWDYEIKKVGLSYTVDTVNELLKMGKKPFVCIGSDEAHMFKTWRKYEEIASKSTLVIFSHPRGGRVKDLDIASLGINDARVILVDFEPVSVSASYIRQLLKSNKQDEALELLPKKVWEYIKQRGLYRDL
jgi:nicotinate-nucleotide adenylyltransferase